MAMTMLLLMRPATNECVDEGRLVGWTAAGHVGARGQGEADALGRRLNHISSSAIYASPLERAVETAQAVASCQKLDVQIRQELGELATGEWTGKLVKELEGTEPWKALQNTPAQFRMPGGE